MLDSFVALAELLAVAKSARPKDWQETVARHVSSLAVDYPSQTDDRIALREASLVSLAAQKGSADARKR